MGNSRRFNEINRDLLSFKAFYFFFMSGFGSLFPYLPVYFRQVGLSASHVGLLIGLRPIVQLASAPFWAIMADKYKKRKAILVMSILAWLVMTLTLAFVEPTDGICEVRAENQSTSRFVNYTKIKTGFFRRSAATREKSSGEERKKTTSDLFAFPIKRMSLQDVFKRGPLPASRSLTKKTSNPSLKTPAKKNRETHIKATSLDLNRSTLQSNFSNNRNIFYVNQIFVAPYKKTRWKTTHVKVKKQTIGRNVKAFIEIRKKTSQNRYSNNNKTTGQNTSHVHNYPNTKGFTARLNVYRSKTPPRRIKAKTEGVQRKMNKVQGIDSDLNFSQWIRERDENTGLFKTNNKYNVTKQKRKKHLGENTLKLPFSHKKTHKTRGILVSFSKGYSLTSQSEKNNIHHIKSDINGSTESGSAELETSGSQGEDILIAENISSTNNVKEATKRLQKQIAKSVNFLRSMANNSSKHLLHKTIAMFSQKENSTVPISAEDKRNISQLSTAFKNLIKSSQKYVSSSDSSAENSAEGSSAFDTTGHDYTRLAHLLLNQKDDLKTMDSLHQDKTTNPNNNVIHHNVLPDHVLANGDTNKTAVSSVEYAQNYFTSGSGLEDKLFSSNKSLNDVNTNTNNSLNKNKLVKEYAQENVNIGEKVQGESQTFSREEFDETLTGKSIEQDDKEISGQSEMKSPFSESTSSQVEIKLKNLLKSNKIEMSRIFTILLILVVVGEFLESPSFTLADASLLERLGENRRFYGKQRLWGSIGFGVFSFIVGILLERSKHVVCGEQYTDYMVCFCAFGIMMLFTLFITTSFDFHYSDIQSSSSSVLSVLCNMHYGSCLLAACVMGINFSMCHNFLTWFLEDLGASKSLMGLAVISRAFADTITFYFAGSIIKAIGQIRVMIMVFISYTVVLLTLSVLQNPWWVIPVEILDGFTYAMAWSACTSYLAGAVPTESVTTLQGILQGVYWGLGTGSGTITGGYLIHHVGVVTTFRTTAGFTFLVCLLFSTVQWKWTNEETSEHPQTKYTYLPEVESKDTEALLSGYDIPREKRKCGRIKFNNPY